MLIEFYNCLVFQPNKDRNSIDYINLLKLKKHLRYLYHPNAGGRISYVYINAAYLRHQYFGVSMDDDISQANRAGGPSHPRQRPESGGGWRHSDAPSTAQTHSESDECIDSEDTPSKFIILYQHGNAEDLGGCYGLLKWMAFTMQVDVVAYDYRGYGFSGDRDQPMGSFSPSENSIYADAELMYKHLVDTGYHPSRIIIMGRSLGGGPACYLAEKHHRDIAGLVLESCFDSCLSVLFVLLPLFWFIDMFVNRARMAKITGCPVLFLHGNKDNVVPFRCATNMRRIAIASRESRLANVHRKSDERLGKDSVNWLSEGEGHTSGTGGGNAQQHQQEQSPANTTGRSPIASPLIPSTPTSAPARSTDDAADGATIATIGEAGEQRKVAVEAEMRVDVAEQAGRAAATTPASVAAASSQAPMSPMSLLNSARSEATYQAILAEEGLRSYANGAEWAGTPEERVLGVFHQWFEGCGHNDMEKRLCDLYVSTLSRFLAFVEATSPLPPSLATSAVTLEMLPETDPSAPPQGQHKGPQQVGTFDEL